MQNYKDTQVQGKVSIGDFGAPADAAGNETTVVAGSVVFKSSNEAVLTVVAEIAKSEYAFRATFTGKAGSADVIITANPDINSDGGLLEITGLTTYVVSTDEATSFKQPTVGDLQPA